MNKLTPNQELIIEYSILKATVEHLYEKDRNTIIGEVACFARLREIMSSDAIISVVIGDDIVNVKANTPFEYFESILSVRNYVIHEITLKPIMEKDINAVITDAIKFAGSEMMGPDAIVTIEFGGSQIEATTQSDSTEVYEKWVSTGGKERS